MKLGLGTAQFGIPYGATNQFGQVAPAQVHAILQLALEHDIELFDSAPAYGTAEAVIGSVLPAKAKLVTKTSIVRRADYRREDIAAIRAAFAQSLARLQRQQVYGLLVHSPDDLLRPGGELIFELLMELRAGGLVQKIGVSVYTQAQIEYCLRHYALDLYQVPLSYVDQRLVRSGVLQDLVAAGAEIHARGIFLQGILLAHVATLPAYFAPWRSRLSQIRDALLAAAVPPAAAALAFVRNRTAASYAIVGVTSESELRELLQYEAVQADALPFDEFGIDDIRLVDPSGWPAMRS